MYEIDSLCNNSVQDLLAYTHTHMLHPVESTESMLIHFDTFYWVHA